MYTEEELLDAVDILVEEYGFYEDEAIEMIAETYEMELLSELDKSTYESAIAERTRRREQAQKDYDDAREKWLQTGEERHLKEKNDALDKLIKNKSKERTSKSLYNHKYGDEIRKEKYEKKLEEMKEKAKQEIEQEQKNYEERSKTREKEKEESIEKAKAQNKRNYDNKERYTDELENSRVRSRIREAEKEAKRKEKIRSNVTTAAVVGSGVAVGGYLAYKKHKAKKEAEARRNRGLRGKLRRLREEEEFMLEEKYGIFEDENGDLFIESEMVEYVMDEYDLYEEDAIDLIMEAFEEELNNRIF